MGQMILKRFSCKNPCKSKKFCGNLPLELHRDKKGRVDILFLTEYPGKNELHDKQFLSTESRHGGVFRRILSWLEDKMGDNWSYGISGLFKAPIREEIIKGNGKVKDKRYVLNSKDLFHCSNEVATKEIEYCDPKLIVSLGDFAFNYIFKHEPKYHLIMENGKFYHNIEVAGEKRSVLCLMHPSWGVRSGGDGCTIGYLFEGIRRAIDFIQSGIDYHIPDKFKTELLTDYDDVKNILNKMRRTPEIVAVDTETDNLNKVYDNKMLSLQLSSDGKTGYVIPIDHYESPFKGNKRLKKLIHSFFTKPNTQTKGYVFVNCKFDYHQLFSDFNVLEINAPLLDCSFAEYTLDENWVRIHGFPAQKGNFSLFALAYRRNFNYYAESDMKETRAILSHLPLEKWTKYGGADVVAPWQIFKTQMLQAERSNYLDGFKKMNLVFLQHLIRACMYCEHTGISINFKQLENLYSHAGVFSKAINEVINEFYKSDNVRKANDILLKEKTGTSGTGLFGQTRFFNPSKNLQRDLLYFKVMGLEPVEDDDDEDKEGGSTGKQFQKQYRDAYPEVSLLEQFNSLNKMKTGFVNPVYDWMSPKSPNRLPDFKDFRARSNFSYLTVTGRLRSFNPNCTRLDTYVNLNGKLVTMQQILDKYNPYKREEITIHLPIDSPTGIRDSYKLYYYRNQKIVDIETDCGRKLGTTYETPYLVLNKNFELTWKFAKDLKVGDTICVCKNMTNTKKEPTLHKPSKYFYSGKGCKYDYKYPTKMNPSLAGILGYLSAEGSGLSFGVKDEKIFNRFRLLWEKTFGCVPKKSIEYRKSLSGNIKFYLQYITNMEMEAYFDGIGYDTKALAHEKRIPWSIMQSSKECIVEFIKCYVEGDGSISSKRIRIDSTSRKMLDDFSLLFLKLGLRTIIKSAGKTKNTNNWRYDCKDMFYLYLSTLDSEKFIKNYGEFPTKRKGDICDGSKNLDYIPYILNALPNDIRKYLNVTYSNNLLYTSITPRFVHELKQCYNSIYRTYRFIIDNNIVFEKVSSIKKNNKADVADFTMANHWIHTAPECVREGSYIANGIAIHNSQQRPSHSRYTKDILTMYTPPKGRCLVKLDYVTFEVKGLGFISRDKAMVKSFNEMHELKRQYREDPTCFFEQGYEIENKNLKKHRKELKERKEKLGILKEASPKDYKEAKEKFDKDLKEYKEAKEKFERLCEERPQEISHNYLVFQTDFHRRSASLFNSIPIEEVTKPMRQNAKGLVFGCLVSKTIISTKYGLYRVEELENHNYKVQSINRKIVNSDGIVCKGEKPVVRVLTRQAALTGTSGHHVLTVNSECKLEMKPLGKLQKGDLVVYQKGVFGNIIPKLGKKEISIEDAEAMGLFTGDGSASQPGKSARLLYGSVDKTEITRFRNFVYKWSGIKGEIKLEHNEGSFAKEAGDDDRWIYRMGVTDKNTWVKLNNFGLLGRQEIRRVPSQILRAKPEYVAAYLRGYFDADGGIRKSSRGYKQLFLNSMNVELLTDVVMLLNLFDISSSIYRGSHLDHKHGEFELIITSSTSIINFYNCIGFGTSIKQKKLEKYVKYIKKTATRKLAIDKVNYPMSHHSVLQKYAMQAGVKTFRSRPVYVNDTLIKPLAHKPIQNTINNIDAYKESFYTLGMKDEWKCLKLLSNPDVKLSPVFEEAVDFGVAPVYDCINVEKYNKWVANGVVISNSIYGRGIPSIAKELKIEEEEAQRYFDLFMANMPQAAQWLKDQPVFGKKNLYVDSPLGRRRRLWGYLMGNKSFDAKMDRYSDNSVIQGSCSDFQLLGTSMSLTMIQKHGRALGQCDEKDVWLETNMIHDSCEFEFPLIDAYYALLTFEELYTNLLERYIHKVFGFKIDVPLEVDFTVGSSYANTEDWDGSKLHAKELMKKLCKDCGERDGVDYSDIYKKAIHHPYFKEYKGIARETCDEWIERSIRDLKYNKF